LYQGDKIVDYFDWMNEDTEFVHQFYFDESKKAIGNSIGFDMLKNKVYRGDKYGKYHSRRDSGKIGLGFSYRMVRLERRDVRLKGSIVLGYGLEKSFDRDYDFSRDAHQDKLHAFGPYQIPGTEHSFKLEIECHDTNMPK
jgi:hypothetical protein